VICEACDVLALENTAPFGAVAPDVVRFVSVLAGTVRGHLPKMPFGIPSNDEWHVRLLSRKKQFVFGVYRSNTKTIGYLGQLDKALGLPVTTRNWNTIAAVLKILKS